MMAIHCTGWFDGRKEEIKNATAVHLWGRDDYRNEGTACYKKEMTSVDKLVNKLKGSFDIKIMI